ncbi:MAG: transposase [Chlamydiales bacterium]
MRSYENSGFSLNASVKIESFDRDALERLIRYCARPCFASENLRMNGPWIIYRLSKPTHKGQRFVQLEPMEFLDRIAAFIPLPRRHRWHYHGAFAPNAPYRKMVIAYSKRESPNPISIHQTIEKTKRASLDWAQLIKRIYEIDPLLCSKCGNKIKIIGFVTHQAEIHRILRRIGRSFELHEFDPAYNLLSWEFCQLIPGSTDGFPINLSFGFFCPLDLRESSRGCEIINEPIFFNIGSLMISHPRGFDAVQRAKKTKTQVLMEEQQGCWSGPDPPFSENHSDPPHQENDYDLPHQEIEIDPLHWED